MGSVVWGSFIALGVVFDGDWPGSVIPAAGATYFVVRGAYLLAGHDRDRAEHPPQ